MLSGLPLRLSELAQRNGPGCEFWIAKAEFDFDKAVQPDAGANGQKPVTEAELEMGYFQSFAVLGNGAVGVDHRRTEIFT